jgi:hypothetical protein
MTRAAEANVLPLVSLQPNRPGDHPLDWTDAGPDQLGYPLAVSVYSVNWAICAGGTLTG